MSMEIQGFGASGPTEKSDPRLDALVVRLAEAQRRSKVRQSVETVVWSIIAGLGAYCALALLHALLGSSAPWLSFAGLPIPEWLAQWREPPVPQHALLSFVVGIATLVVGVVGVIQSNPAVGRMARRADRRFNLDERMSTALEVTAGTGVTGVIAEALVQDAEKRTNAVVPTYLAPVGLPRTAIAIPVLLVLGTWLSIAPPPPLLQEAIDAFRPVPIATGLTAEERDEATARLRAVAAIIQQDGEERADPQLQAIARALQALGDGLAQQPNQFEQMMNAEMQKLLQLAKDAYARAGERDTSPRNLSRLITPIADGFKPKPPPQRGAQGGPQNQLGAAAAGGAFEPEVNTMPKDNPFTGLMTTRDQYNGAGREDFNNGQMRPGQTLGDNGGGAFGAPGDGIADAMGNAALEDDAFFAGGAYDGGEAGVGGELAGGADGAGPGDFAGVGTRDLFGPEGRLRLAAGAQDMRLQNQNLGQGRRTRFNLLAPPTEATAADGAQPGEVAGWRQMEEAEVTRAPLPIPSRDVVSRYFRALIAGRVL